MEKENCKKLNITAIQMSSIIGDKFANFSKVQSLIENNINESTDIIVLPEVWTVGWKPSLFKESAEDINGETIAFLSKIAKKYSVNIIGGSFISRRKDAKMQRCKEHHSQFTIHHSLFNSCPVINRNGELIATYDKMHLFSYYGCDEGKFIKSGQNPVMINFCLNSREIASVGTSCLSQQPSPRNDDMVKIGLTICYDIRFPEIYRAYAKAGADLLVNMAAWPMSRAIHWEALSKARAIENQCFMVALTQSGLIENDEYNLGHSRIIDYEGNVVSEIKEGEGTMSAEIKFNEMYEFRKKCTVLLDIHDRYELE